MKNVKILAAKKLIGIVYMLSGALVPTVSNAGIPVLDGSNLSQNVMTAVESIAQTIQQAQQYTTQVQQYANEVQQYQNMLQNTLQPATYQWDQAQTTTNSLLGSINTLNSYKAQYGNLANYLNHYKNVAQYQTDSCFSAGSCSSAQWATLSNSHNLASTAQRNAINASFQGLDQQQANLQNDANALTNLQNGAQSANGHMQALGYGNQIASHQANQLLQIRGLLIAEQNVNTTRNQALADREAQQAAAATQIRTGNFTPSPQMAW